MVNMENEWRNGVANHRLSSSVIESPVRVFQISSPANSSASSSPACSPFSGNGSVALGVGVGVGGCNYIEHRVSKFDTLAGVAIKYGVEVIVVVIVQMLNFVEFDWCFFS